MALKNKPQLDNSSINIQINWVSILLNIYRLIDDTVAS